MSSPAANPLEPGGRKRLPSMTDDSVFYRKRPRISAEFPAHFTCDYSTGISANLERLPQIRRSLDGSIFNAPRSPLYTRSLSGSFLAGSSRSSTPWSEIGMVHNSDLDVMRSICAESFRSSSPNTPNYSEISAKYYLRNSKVTIDFAPPSEDAAAGMLPLSLSVQNVVIFSRGNRVHYKNMTTNEDIGQLCRVQDKWGLLRCVSCAGADQPNIVALGSGKGVQLWDLATKKLTANWTTREVTAMHWNGPVLTVGGVKGTIRHFDTRTKETPKMKEQALKVTRHQAKITRLGWNVDGKLLASGDESGTVYCWDSRQKIPLDIGEFFQRRKKMQHPGAITALTWCPWLPKLLATGDSDTTGRGTIRLWNVNTSSAHCNAANPGKIELDAQITSLHFSPHCKEILSTHGPGPVSDAVPPSVQSTQSQPRDGNVDTPPTPMNSIMVHSYPSLRSVIELPAAPSPIGDSVLTGSGMKVVLAVPKEGKLKVWDVWGKRKEIRRRSSLMERASIR